MDFSQLAHDFGQRYAGSYIFLKQKDNPEELVHINKCWQSDPGFPYIEFSSDDLGTNVVKYDTDCVFEFRRPRIGVFQSGKVACVITRLAAQQFSKGVSTKTYQIFPVFASYSPFGIGGGRWLQALKDSYNPSYSTWGDALKKMQSGKYLAVALNNRYALSAGFDEKNFMLFHYAYPVGKVFENGSLDFKATDAGSDFAAIVEAG